MQLRTILLRIVGHVQGVGFRDALVDEAGRLALTGWVRNRADGSVEAVARGTPDSLDALCAWARRGPPAARVVRVERAPAPAEFERVYARFERWPTA